MEPGDAVRADRGWHRQRHGERAQEQDEGGIHAAHSIASGQPRPGRTRATLAAPHNVR